MYLAVTCHLHLWQNDRDLFSATAVIQVWDGYQNKSQYRKLTLEKKILSPFLQGFKLATDLSITSLALKPLSCPHSPLLKGKDATTNKCKLKFVYYCISGGKL